ncbi:transcriptional regulator ATRX [Ostrinia nubilalis]|uniref:transcriptional regulator ATRX n=1 Tax=Ostrinia nubilalis TaxID=29057 RepID=UPI0030826004
MSTRSGKRIHGSIHENITNSDSDMPVKSERKTRSRRLKENYCDEVIVPKSKKRHNYVRYPTDDEQSDTTQKQTNGEVPKTSKTTLKEQDLNVSIKTVDEIDSGKVVRQTRRTKKLSENVPEDIPVVEIVNVKTKKKNKKNKKKKGVTDVPGNENEELVEVPKKSKRKKGKTSNTIVEVPLEVVPTGNLNKSNDSVESFHSAAGSPIKILDTEVEKLNGSCNKSPRRASKRFKADSHEDDENGEAATLNRTFEKNPKKMKLSNCNNDSLTNGLLSDDESNKEKDATFDKSYEVAEVLNSTFEKKSKKKRKSSIKNSTFDKQEVSLHELISEIVNSPMKDEISSDGESKGRRKSLRSTYDKTESPKRVEVLNSTYEKCDTSNQSNKTFEGDKSNRKFLRSTFDKTNTPTKNATKLNSTFDKGNTPNTLEKTGDIKERRKSLRSTFDKDTPSKNAKTNSTFEKANTPNKPNRAFEGGRRMSLRLSTNADKQSEKESFNVTFENPKETSSNSTLNKSGNHKLNSTFDKSKDSQRSAINTTFDKSKESVQSKHNSTFDKETKLDSTFDKPQNQSDSNAKSSLTSSDSASNLTFDKSDEISRISITSDDSRTENIVNTTPLLIESSMDESQVLEPSPRNLSQSSDETKLKTATPLKREGTFTKDSPVAMSPKEKGFNKTPVRRMSLPSPGSTPFPFSKSSQKERSMLNVTRSIEKAERGSPRAAAGPRATRVMFCSPVNNPVAVMQQKRKVIKSNLKGSNKSFIFDESVSESARPAARKRSYTQSDADEAHGKRKRLDSQQQAAARLSRPRSSSATVKLPEPSTPSKKPVTPLKKICTPSNAKSDAKVSRTKLPNFAALHRAQFAKMESLDECQVRKAKRAKQLLTPTGLAIIEKSSPKGRGTTSTQPTKVVTEAFNKSVEVLKKPDAEISKKAEVVLPKKPVAEVPKKTDTPSKAPKAFTLDSLRPGYTRFGFKMNLDVNPFSIPPRPDAKPKETKPNGLVTRQPSQPSLAGATSSRREMAKQIVMRERSFTSSLSDKRNEKRTMIKGVRTNRRFDLQMKLRNINS